MRISRLVSCCAMRSSLVQRKPPILANASFLAEKVQPSAKREHLLGDAFRGPIGVARLALVDEPGVFGEAAGVQIERECHAARSHALDRLDVGHGDRLPAAGVIGDGEHDQRNACRAFGGDQGFQRAHVHVALEIQARLRVGGFGNGQIHGARAGEFDIGAGGIEVGVGGDHVAGLAHHGEQDAFGRASLVGGNHVAEAGQLVGRALQAEEALAAGVGFVAAHHGGPLLGGHGAGARIGQQIDQDVARVDEEQVVAGLFAGSSRAPRAWCGAAARRS